MRDYQHPMPEALTVVDVLKALADPLRLEIVDRLDVEGELTCGALLGARPKSSMSHHFNVLRASGLVWTRVEGVQHYNALRRACLNERFPGLLDAVLSARRRAHIAGPAS